MSLLLLRSYGESALYDFAVLRFSSRLRPRSEYLSSCYAAHWFLLLQLQPHLYDHSSTVIMLLSIQSAALTVVLLLTIVNSVTTRLHDCVNRHFYGKLPHDYSFDGREPVGCMRHVLKEHQTTSHRDDVELSTYSE
jgi:hypothetical protein